MKRFSKFIYVLLIFTISYISFSDNSSPVKIEVFKRDDCGNCANLKKYLYDLETKRDDFQVIEYDVYTKEGEAFFNKVTDKLKLVKGTPIIYVNETILQGFDTPETTGKTIEALIDNALTKDSVLSLEEYYTKPNANTQKIGAVCKGADCEIPGMWNEDVNNNTYNIKVPFTNNVINLKSYSLPVISFVLGLIDGFNPCAMWVLVLFLTSLIAVGNKKKMIYVAGVFILAEGIMYYLILNVWLTTFNFIKLDNIVTPLVGVLAIVAGIIFIRKFIKTKDDLFCEVTDLDKRASISTKIRNLAHKPIGIMSFLGILGLAFSVNIIEFACSAGIPQTFAKILDMNNLSFWKNQFYNFIYIFAYMLDDIAVFLLALFSIEKIGLTTKYSKYSSLLGGILMIILGLILLLNPKLLVL